MQNSIYIYATQKKLTSSQWTSRKLYKTDVPRVRPDESNQNDTSSIIYISWFLSSYEYFNVCWNIIQLRI